MNTEFNELEDAAARAQADKFFGSYKPAKFQGGTRRVERGREAVWQARLALLVMINIAQLWVLSAAVEAALAREFKQLLPLIIASGVCWLIALTIFLWWKPASRRRTSTGYVSKR